MILGFSGGGYDLRLKSKCLGFRVVDFEVLGLRQNGMRLWFVRLRC